MNSTYSRLKNILSLFGVYDTENNNFIQGEITAYSAGIEYVDNILKELERECFVHTAQTYGLEIKERLFDSIERQSTTENRREMLLKALSITKNDFNTDGMRKYLSSFPAGYSIGESHSTNTVNVTIDRNGWSIENSKHITDSIRRFFPAHLLVNVLFLGILWTEIDNLDLTFQEMEDKNYDWQTVEAYLPEE